MRIITDIGYYATGSSAIKDFCKEFSECADAGNYEFRFAQDPTGLSDLEYNIIENNHRHNTSNAIKDFYKLMKFYNGRFYTKRYRKFFGKNFMNIVDEYIENIVGLKTKTWWHFDQYKKGEIFYFVDILYGKITAKFMQEGCISLLKGAEKAYYTYIDKEKFYQETKKFTNKLFNIANKEKKDFLIVDQLISPSNVNRYLNYFDDIKVIIVERDPRDLYIASKQIYCEGIIPVDTVEDFCKWYQITREHRKHEMMDKNKVLLINFEDLIYNYNESTQKVMKFLGLNARNHIEKYKYFDPKKSIRGTKLIERFPKFKKDVNYIEKHLSEYIYEYK